MESESGKQRRTSASPELDNNNTHGTRQGLSLSPASR